jgi:amidohydrolase
LGENNVLLSKLQMGGEDFSFFDRKAPGCFFFIGGAPAQGPNAKHHQANFDVDEGCLPIGTALLAETAMRFLRSKVAA